MTGHGTTPPDLAGRAILFALLMWGLGILMGFCIWGLS